MSNFAFEAIDEYHVAQSGYEGTLENIVEECGQIEDRGLTGDNFWYPARLARAVIDLTIADNRRPELISTVTQFALDAYAGREQSANLSPVVAALEQQTSFARLIRQEVDLLTTASTTPKLSRQTAQAVAAVNEDAPTLHISLAHGGFVSGIETQLYLNDIRGKNTADFLYPIRYSSRKLGDRAPYVNDEEIEMLAGLQDHRLIITTEDSSTGETLRDAQTDITEMLGRMNSEVYANVDAVDPKIQEYLDAYFARYRDIDPIW